MFNEKNEIKKKLKYISNKKNESVLDSIILNYLMLNIKKEKCSFKDFICFFEKKVINTALNVTNGNQRVASEILGIKTTTLNEKIKKLGVNREDFSYNILKVVENKIELINKNKYLNIIDT